MLKLKTSPIFYIPLRIVLVLFFHILLFSSQYPLLGMEKDDLETEFYFSITIMVRNAIKAQEEIKKLTKNNNGYMKSMNNHSMVIRIPKGESLNRVMEKLLTLGIVIHRDFKQRNASLRLNDLRTSIDIKTKHIKKLNNLFQQTNLRQTLELEKEVSRAVIRLEFLKGKLYFLKDRIKHANVRINFSYKNNKKIDSGIEIQWINRLGIDNFISNFHY